MSETHDARELRALVNELRTDDGYPALPPPQSVAVRYLLVELPLADGSNGTADPEDEHYRIRDDVAEFLWEDPALVDSPSVRLVYPGDVVPGGETA